MSPFPGAISDGNLLLNPGVNGFEILRDLCSRWSQLNITQIGSLIAIGGALPTAWRLVQHISNTVYGCVRRFFLASVVIPEGDPLNRQVVKWVQENHPSHHRSFTGLTHVGSAALGDRAAALKRTRHETLFVPHWRLTWFVHSRRLFIVTRTYGNICPTNHDPQYDGYGGEELVVSCLGWSINPIKDLMRVCREYTDRREQYFVIIYARDRYGLAWKPKTRRPIRRLDTVHFDSDAKKRLIGDIRNYLDVKTQQLYQSRSMPYRRGYLFHGPPGTGKSSLSVAIAGEFGLDLYEVKIPNVGSDADLEQMFQEIPPRCVVLLEDIDAVWGDRAQAGSKGRSEDNGGGASHCTLSGLLNVLDGVGTPEGRIVIMTTNRPEQLDEALTRPGRVDMQVHLGNISPRSAEEMFMRMFSSESGYTPPIPEERMREFAVQFACCVPADSVTPSRLQGFFQLHLLSPEAAVDNIKPWLLEEGFVGSEKEFDIISNA